MSAAHDAPVRHAKQGPVATVTLNRPDYRNAQDSTMTYALERAFCRAAIPGVEYFAHPWVMPPRITKEFLVTGDRTSAQRAYEVGMVNRVVTRVELPERTRELALRIAQTPRLGLALTKRAVYQAEDLQGMRTGMDSVFGLHHLAHAPHAETAPDALDGMDIRPMKEAGA